MLPNMPSLIDEVNRIIGRLLFYTRSRHMRNPHYLLYVAKRIVTYFVKKEGWINYRMKDYPEHKKPENPLYLNIGGGGFYHPHWINLDYCEDFGEKSYDINMVNHDLCSMKPLPFENDSFKIVYSSHCIEHIPDAPVMFLFEEIRRILRPGGVCRIVCPDIDIYYEAYKAGSPYQFSSYSRNPNRCLGDFFLSEFAAALAQSNGGPYSEEEIRKVFYEKSKEDALEFFCRQIPVKNQTKNLQWHMNWFNERKLRTLMVNCGFRNVKTCSLGCSRSTILRNTDLFDSSAEPPISLYMEAEK